MRIHWAGKYNGDENTLPQREHEPGAVQFKEPEDMEKFAKIMAGANIVVFFILYVGMCLLARKLVNLSLTSFLLGMVCLVPHEFLHAIFLREDAYIYTNLSQGMLFVIGTENMSKLRFCIMSAFPSIVFGIIPAIIYIINPSLEILGGFAIFSLSAGVGDYLNIYNSITQMPKGAKTYLCGMHSYWYIPKEKE